jgi:hypothetical protein
MPNIVPTWIETKWYKLPNTDVMFKMFCDLRWLQAYSLQVHIVLGEAFDRIYEQFLTEMPNKTLHKRKGVYSTPKTTFVLPTSASQLRSGL